VTQPYLSYRCWLLHAQAVSAAPAASFKPTIRPSGLLSVRYLAILSVIEELAALPTVDRSIAISSAGLYANAREPVSIAVSMIGFATFSASWPFANITTPDFLAGSAITKALKTPLSPNARA